MSKWFESLEGRTFFSAGPVTLEAESAAMYGAAVGHDVAGHTGSGFADFQHSAGDWWSGR